MVTRMDIKFTFDQSQKHFSVTRCGFNFPFGTTPEPVYYPLRLAKDFVFAIFFWLPSLFHFRNPIGIDFDLPPDRIPPPAQGGTRKGGVLKNSLPLMHPHTFFQDR